MNQTRTILGLLIMIFLAIPVLFGIIWAVGLTQAVVSQKTLTEFPGKIIAEVPNLLDGMLLVAQDENSSLDYDSRTWLKAMAGASPPPRELLEETGLNNWLEKELSGSLRTLGDILNGKTAARDIWLDMRPLKSIFSHPIMERWLSQVMENLPACSSSQAQDWERIMLNESPYDSLPPCRPDAAQKIAAVSFIRSHITREIPDQVNLMENAHFPHNKFDVAKTVRSFTYLLFLIPAVLIAFGALVAARSKSHFFRWSGAATMIGSGLVLAMSSLVKGVIPWAMRIGPVNYSSSWTHWQDIFSDHMGGLAMVISRHFMSPVIAVGGTVCVVGLLLFAFSFTFNRETEAKTQPPQQPQAS